MKVVFLDIDGVLATDCTDFRFFDSSCLRRLKHIVEATDASIVLSSTWRRGRTIENIRGLFSRDGDDYGCWVANPVEFPVHRIIGKTHYFFQENNDRKERGLSWGRGYEIEFWLEQAAECRGDIESYLILDDDSADLQTHGEHLLRTDSRKGLLDEDIPKAIKILNTPWKPS